jgi:hypothetical protein
MSTSWTDYLFLLGDPEQFHLTFTVVAKTREQAVKKANEALAKEECSHSVSLYGPARDGDLAINGERVRVAVNNIVNESPSWLSPPEKANTFLIERGYEWSETDQIWSDYIMETGEGNWNFTYATAEGIYGMLRLDARPDYNMKDWSFRYSLRLYPMAQWNIHHNKVAYRIELTSAHDTMDQDELIKWLPRYEQKFAELTYVLRQADPEDGYPLLPDEKAVGHIINIDWRRQF